MSDSSPLGLSKTKPAPQSLSYKQAMAQYRFLCDALRQLAELELENDLAPESRATALALRAILEGESNGKA